MDPFAASVTLLHGALDNGGATLHADGDHILNTETRWVVAVRPAQSVTIPASVTGRLAVEEWVDFVNVAGLAADEGVGSWKDGSTVVLDVVRFVGTRAAAVRLGRASGQQAIYHPATGNTVFLKGASK